MTVIETIRTSYQELFTIKLLHVGFEKTISHKDPVTHAVTSVTQSSIFEVFSIQPDAATRKFFADHDMNYKCNNNMIICYVRTESTKPFVSFPAIAQIRFLINVQPAFLNKTNIEATGSKEVYQFTNVARAGGGANKFLTVDASGPAASDKKSPVALKLNQNCFAVIDILTDVADAEYRVFNSGDLASPDYKILFIPR